MRAGRRSKRVAFVAFLALTTFGALATASAQPADIKAIDKAFQDHYARGKYPTAQIDAQELERLVKARFGADHPYYAVALNKLAIVFQAQGKYTEAEGLFKRALAIREKALGTTHPDVGQTLNNLALIYRAQGKYSEAEGLLKRALVIREKALGSSHPDVGQSLNNLANVYLDQGKYSEAEGLFKRALAIRETALGANHRDVGTTLNNLALVYWRQGKYSEAEGLLKRALVIREKALGSSHPDVGQSLNNLANVYRDQGKYSEAEGLFKRALAIREKALGANHRDVGQTLHNLALVYAAQRKYGEAEELYKRALAVREQALGASHPDVGQTLHNLGNVYRDQGKYAEAEEFLKRALTIRETALDANHRDVGQTVNNLALVYQAQGKYSEAEGLLKRALVIREQVLGASHPDVGQTLTNLANVYQDQGKYGEAEGLFKRALSITENANGANHPDVAWTLTNLALLYWRQGKYGDAEALHKRALAIREQVLGESHPGVADSLNYLALVYWTQGKYSEAEGLYKRALAILEKALGANHRSVGWTLNDLALVYWTQGKYSEAEGLYKRALAIRETVLGANHAHVGQTLNNLANVYRAQGKYNEAEELFKRALAIRETALGANHRDVGTTLNNLALVYRDQGKYAEAEALFKRALTISEQALGTSHPDVARTLNNMTILYEGRGESGSALAYSRKATSAILAHRAAESTGTPQPGTAGGLVEWRASYFQRHVANLAVAAGKGIEPVPSLAHEAIEVAQWASQSLVARAVQQMSTRFASGADALASLVRESQDLAAAWRDKDKALLDALSNLEGQYERARIDGLRREMAETERRLNAIAARIDKEFPDYAALAGSKPPTAEEVQRLLGADEALVFFLAGSKESYAFALTRERFEWRTISLGEKDMAAKVAAFRRGLDVDELTKSVSMGKAQLFDLAAAHELYVPLFGPIEALIKDKPLLLIVPSGPLTALPFHLLVTDKPAIAVPQMQINDMAAYRDAAWLVKRHAVTVLPSVASLKALRVFARKGQGTKPMIGFGDPVFAPDQSAAAAGQPTATVKVATRTRAYADYWHGASVNRARLAEALSSLPDSAEELMAVAAKLGASANDIHLGRNATEANVKRLPLADYRVVYFATHGLVAGDVEGLGEPSLALTLPNEPSELDDGLLTASEVAQLKLNADWVVLSACNTAAGGKPGAEALSGLARAFFYAGARALLVSHWGIDSKAATRLATSTFDIMKSNQTIGRAEAVRRAMLAYLDDRSDIWNAYPGFWGSFSLVGEGAAR
jgi:tetratricopeptide (TPR) repeat protein/CHAT domain-containing protein